MAVLDPSTSALGTLAQRPAVRQFVKFCIVGASSTVISGGTFALLIYVCHLDQLLHVWLAGLPSVQQWALEWKAYVQVAAFAGFLLGVTNGFIWNSRWTFRQKDPKQRKAQYAKFVMSNAIGLVLNQIIVFTVTNLLTANRPSTDKGWEPMAAFAIATAIVVFWNFAAAKYWTFKQ